jgi:hypothetical protein
MCCNSNAQQTLSLWLWEHATEYTDSDYDADFTVRPGVSTAQLHSASQLETFQFRI